MRVLQLLAPGPSMNSFLAQSLRGCWVGAVGNAYELAPWADFLVATDAKWWAAHPWALAVPGRKFSCQHVAGVEWINEPTNLNSGVLALHVALLLGAKEIHLHGFDMHGSHFFGPYVNGLKNTTEPQRQVHLEQFREWSRRYSKKVKVLNCTPDSRLDAFPMRVEETA